jgi:hypothetical protein
MVAAFRVKKGSVCFEGALVTKNSVPRHCLVAQLIPTKLDTIISSLRTPSVGTITKLY